jgi:hypothetical protein
MRRLRLTRIISSCAALALLAFVPFTDAGEYRDPCDGPETNWKVSDRDPRDSSVRVVHRRNTDVRYEGSACDQFVFRAARYETDIGLSERLPKPARVIPELKATLWVRSNHPGARLCLRVVFPHQQDPQANAVLTTLIEGSQYDDVREWQQLTCETSEKAMQNEIRLLRARFQPATIDTRESYVTAVVVNCPLDAGSTEIFLDDLHVGPLVEQRDLSRESGRLRPIAEVHQGRFEVAGQPRLTIMVIDQGEQVSTFRALHANTVLVREAQDRKRLGELHEQGIWAAADPTTAQPFDVETAESERGAPSPFESPDILMWYLGTKITSRAHDEMSAMIGQLKRCDYRLRRPTVADVVEDERYYSRYVSVLGTSRHVCGTTFSFKDYRNWLLQRSKLANPGSNLFTWIQTEPVPAANSWRAAAGLAPAVIEPEQIRLQLYAAIGAGFRGFGYWNVTSLESSGPGSDERRLVMTELNLELELIEPLLATANLDRQVPFRVPDPPRMLTRRDFDFVGNDAQREIEIKKKLNERDIRLKDQILGPSETEAAIFQGPFYKLVVATWLAHDAQFTPGRLAGNDVKINIPEPSEAARYWEITPVAVRELKKEKVAGYYQVTLPKFDETAVILVSSDPGLRDRIDERVKQTAAESARTMIELAKAKLARVQAVDAQLVALGEGQPDGAELLFAAQRRIERAQSAFVQSGFIDAWEAARDATQFVRVLQYAHWNEAVTQSTASSAHIPTPPKPTPQTASATRSGQRSRRGKQPAAAKPKTPPIIIPFPTLSSHTICFQTLPEHWRMIERIGRSADRPLENVLPGGDFEAPVPGWVQSQNAVEGVQAQAELYPEAHGGTHSLQLIAVPVAGVDPPEVIPRAPVSVISPAVPVSAGQILYISGWIRIMAPVTHSLDGVTINDSVAGMPGALRFTTPAGWQRFQMLRDVRTNRDLTLTISLHGMGAVLIDDLQIVPHEPVPVNLVDGIQQQQPPRPVRQWYPARNEADGSAPSVQPAR